MNLSPSSLFASLMISTIGFGFFIYGKKQARMPQLLAGLAMMIYPYFVGSVPWMLTIGAVVVCGLVLAVRAGL